MKASTTITILTCLFTAILLNLAGIKPIFAQGKDDVHITENTTWSGNVNVSADTYIDEGVTLTINPGSTITFTGFYSLGVVGTILAEGTQTDSIHFAPSNISTGWNRILFIFTSSASDSSKFSHCSFKYSKALDDSYLGGEAGGAMYLNYFGKISIQNCLFKNNYALTLGGAIYCNYSSPLIVNNIFDNNSADIDAGAIEFNYSHPKIIGNLFINNQTIGLGGACDFAYSSPHFTNNTFADNHAGYWGGAVCIDIDSEPVFTNCIFYNNSADEGGDEVAITNTGSPDFYYCLVSGGTAAFGGDGAAGYSGNYENNIDGDPAFQGSGNEAYNISVSSPCLNTGNPDLSGLNLPALDLAGHPRVAEGCLERIDMGAYENQSQATTSIAGNISHDAQWCADTVRITGDLTVNDGVTLTIEKGTVVYIAGAFCIDIKGCLKAIGDVSDSIAFTTENIWPYWFWGGMKFHNLEAGNDSSIISYCRFNLSSPGNYTGGAISIDTWDKIEISNSSFFDNNAQHGGALAISNASITLNNCLISNNSSYVGAGIYANNSTLKILDCTISGNKAENGNCNNSSASDGGGIYIKNCTSTITNCNLANNKADCNGGGIYCDGQNLQLQNSNLNHNHASMGGGIYLSETSGEIAGNDISHNTGDEAGGMAVSGGSLTISKNRITNNYASYEAAMYLSNCNPNIINNLIANNHAGTAGGGITFHQASPLFLNNTICDNHADNYAGCLHFGSNSNSSPEFRNCIIYGNYVTYYDGDNVFMYDDSGQPNFYYCDLEGGTADFGGYFNNYTGDFEDNLNSDPVFKNSGEYPYQLQQHSPCINSADAATDTISAGTLDLANNPRVQNGRIDMGCYENESFSDAFPGEAIHFTETDDLIVLENESRFDFTESFTVEFWINCDEMATDNHVILKKGDAWAMQLFYNEAISILEFSVNSGGVFGDYQTTGTALLKKWNHVAGVCTKKEAGGFDISVYLNGIQGTQDNVGSLTHNNSPLTIGNDFLGKIDELRIWNKALSAQEIREQMHLIIPPEKDSLVTYLQFNQNYDGRLIDIAGGNNGTLHNMDLQANFTSSTVPAAQGTSNTQLVNTIGEVVFLGTGLSMDFTDKYDEDEIVVSRLDTTPNLSPSLLDAQYWIIERYGTGSFNANITLRLSEDITTEDESSPAMLKLSTRSVNSDNHWSYATDASSADAANNTTTFNNISHYGQIAVCRRVSPDQTAGNALAFDGDLDYVNGSGITATLVAFTIEAWVYHNSLPQEVQRYISIAPDMAVLRFDGSTYGGSDELHFYLKDAEGTHHGIRANNVLTTDVWQHVAGTFDGTVMNLYYNGELVQTKSVEKELNVPDGNFTLSHISETLDGQMDEVRIWNYARDNDEIRIDMYRTLPSSTDQGLVAYWQFNESSGTELSDITRINTGTLQHMNNSDWIASTAPVPYQSAADGNWSSTGTWNAGQDVPEKDWARVQINNNVILDQAEILVDLSIESSASLSISSNSSLTVTGNLNNQNGTAGLILKSDAGATASLIHETTGVAGTAERFIPQYVGAAGWHDLSSPVAAQAIRPGFVPNENPIPGSNDFYKYDEHTDYWINTKDEDGNWNTNFEDDFVVGRGYNVAYANDETKSFSGELNVGDFTFDETTTPAITYTADGGIGWNLMGNPYPSSLDWNLCTKENIDAAVYAYDGDAGQYKTWSAGIGNLTDGIIPPMNGFFIKASANPELTIPNSARVHTSANFYKEKNYVEDLLVIEVEGNGFSDKTFIHFNAYASNEFDSDFDAYKLSGISEAPQLYTKAGDSKLSINVLPYTSEEIAIPLCLKVGNETEYIISVNENTFWETVDISLKDLETGILYDLRTITQLTINQSTTNPDRFLLLINGATDIEETTPDNGIQIYSYGDQIFIKTEDPGDVQVAVYNLLGQNVLSQTLTGFETLSEFTTAKPGFYLVVVQTGEAIKTKKVFIK